MAANCRETATRREQPRREQRSITLGFADSETRVALSTDAAHCGHAIVEVGVEIFLDALARVFSGLEAGTGARTEVHVHVDQTRREKLARAVDLI